MCKYLLKQNWFNFFPVACWYLFKAKRRKEWPSWRQTTKAPPHYGSHHPHAEAVSCVARSHVNVPRGGFGINSPPCCLLGRPPSFELLTPSDKPQPVVQPQVSSSSFIWRRSRSVNGRGAWRLKTIKEKCQGCFPDPNVRAGMWWQPVLLSPSPPSKTGPDVFPLPADVKQTWSCLGWQTMSSCAAFVWAQQPVKQKPNQNPCPSVPSGTDADLLSTGLWQISVPAGWHASSGATACGTHCHLTLPPHLPVHFEHYSVHLFQNKPLTEVKGNWMRVPHAADPEEW